MPIWRRRTERRQFRHGRTTGMAAATRWDEQQAMSPQTMVSGPDVCLIREPAQLIIAERPTDGRGVVRLQIPLRSCVEAQIVDEPGLPGDAMVRLTLAVRIGKDAVVTVPMWFPAEYRPFLNDLTRRIRSGEPANPPAGPACPPLAEPACPPPGEPACQPPAGSLPLLEVALAPGDDDWVVFRPAASSNDVLVPRAGVGGPVAQPTEGAR
jgi:hypothetical protein